MCEHQNLQFRYVLFLCKYKIGWLMNAANFFQNLKDDLIWSLSCHVSKDPLLFNVQLRCSSNLSISVFLKIWRKYTVSNFILNFIILYIKYFYINTTFFCWNHSPINKLLRGFLMISLIGFLCLFFLSFPKDHSLHYFWWLIFLWKMWNILDNSEEWVYEEYAIEVSSMYFSFVVMNV